MKALFTFVSFILFLKFSCFAQQSKNYQPFIDDSITLAKIKDEIKQKYLKDSAAITGENKKYTVNLYRDRFKFINSLFSSKQLIVNNDVEKYLSKITTEIISKNPVLKNIGTRFLFSRAYWPNAFSTGEGTIVFNIGLFSRLENESQVAFVICHELSHLYLDHSNKAIYKYINTIYSDEFQEKLKEIKKQKYEQNKELDKLEKGVAFSDRRHSRLHETEADSLAFVFLLNTTFNSSASAECLGILDRIDKDIYNTEEGLNAIFNSSEYPFQKRWIKQEAAFFDVSRDNKEVDKEEDSLKTHPDCKARIERINSFLSKNTNTNKVLSINEEDFKKMQRLFTYEIIEYCLTSKNISRCLYQSMELYNKNTTDPYIICTIGKCFNLIYENQKNHTLNQIVSLPNPLGEKNYNTLLEFIQNIRLDNIASINYYFLKNNEPLLSNNSEFNQVYKESKNNFAQHK